MNRITIEKKQRGDAQAVETLRKRLIEEGYADGRAVDRAIGVRVSGLPLDVVDAALLELCSKYPCRVGSDDDGALMFRFGSLADDRSDHPFVLWLASLRSAAAKWRDPVVAALTLLLFPVLGVFGVNGGFTLAAIANHADGAISYARIPLTLFAALVAVAWGLPGLLLWTFLALVAVYIGFVLMPLIIAVLLVMDWPGLGQAVPNVVAAALMGWLAYYTTKTLREMVVEFYRALLQPERAHWAQVFWRAVGGILFGPRVPASTPLQDERKLVRRITDQDGFISAHDLTYLFGWTLEESDSELVRVLLDYGGDIVVSDHGSILYVFDDLDQGSQDEQDVEPFWEAPERQRFPFFDGPRPLKIAAGLMVGVPMLGTIVGSIYGLRLLPAPGEFFAAAPTDVASWGWVSYDTAKLMQGFGFWPWLIVLLVLALRMPSYLWRNLRLERAAKRMEIARLAVDSPQGGWLATSRADSALLSAFDGEVDEERGVSVRDGDQKLYVRFPALAQAVADASALRESNPHEAPRLMDVQGLSMSD